MQTVYTFETDDVKTKIVREAQLRDRDTFFELPSAQFLYQCSKGVEPPKDWILLFTMKGEVFNIQDAMMAEVHFNDETNQLLVVFKLVDISLEGDAYEVARNTFQQGHACKVNSAFTFTEMKVRQFASTFKCKPQLIITGHALSGFLAQLVTYTVQFLHLDDKGCVCKTEDDTLMCVYTVVFDAPPALDKMQKIAGNASHKCLTLPIANFNVNRNLFALGSHVESIILLDDFDQINSPAHWRRLDRNAAPSNSNSRENQESSIKGVKFDHRDVSLGYFTHKEQEALRELQHVALYDQDLKKILPTYVLQADCVKISENSRAEEFIPQARFIILKAPQSSTLKERVEKELKDNVEAQIYTLSRDYSSLDLKNYRLSNENVQKVKSWKNGTRVSGFSSFDEQVLLGNLIRNSGLDCYLVKFADFSNPDILNKEKRDKWLNLFCGILILIDSDLQQLEVNKMKATVVYFDLAEAAGEKKRPLTLADMGEESQNCLNKLQMPFFGNMVSAEDLFRTQIENISILDMISFECNTSPKESEFYFAQSIANKTDRQIRYVDYFARYISSGVKETTVLSCEAGMGKTTTMKRLANSLQNNLKQKWIVELDFGLHYVQNRLADIKSTENLIFDIVKQNLQATIPGVAGNIMQTIFFEKFKSCEMVFLIDSFDEACPQHREVALRFIQNLAQSGMKMVIATRPREKQCLVKALNLQEADVFEIQVIASTHQAMFLKNLWSWRGTERDRDEAALFLRELKGESSKMCPNLRPDFVLSNDEALWGVPLNLVIVADIFPNCILTEDFKKHNDLYKVFIDTAIDDALTIKLKIDRNTNQRSIFNKEAQRIRILLQKLAVAFTFNHGECIDLDIDDKELLNNLTRVKVSGNMVSFSHKSFCEYLLAQAVVFAFHQYPQNSQNILTASQCRHVLQERNFMEVRQYINLILSHSTYKVEPIKIYEEDSRYMEVVTNQYIKEKLFHLYKLMCKVEKIDLNMLKMRMRNCWLRTRESPLHLAIKLTGKEFIEFIISQGADVSAVANKDPENAFVLHYLVMKGLDQFVKDEFNNLCHALNEKIRDEFESTPLDFAARSGNFEIARFLLDQGADVQISKMALTYATADGNEKLVELLLRHGAPVDERIVQKAAFVGNLACVRMLLDKTQIELKPRFKQTIMMMAAESGHDQILKLLIESDNADAKDESGMTTLHFAASRGHATCARILIEDAGAQINVMNTNNETPLFMAASGGHSEVVKMLLDKGANAFGHNLNGDTCLHKVVAGGSVELVKVFLSKQLPIDARNKLDETPLVIAIKGKHLEVCQVLLENLADPNITTKKSWTCLHYAVYFGDVSFIELLVKHKVYIDCKTNEGQTPLHLARSRILEVEFLLANGADPLVEDNNGYTSLHWAVQGGSISCITMLLKRVQVDFRSKKQLTPLHLAVRAGQHRIQNELLIAGADLLAVDADGWTVLHHAAFGGNVQCAEYILEDQISCINGKINITLIKKCTNLKPFLGLDRGRKNAIAHCSCQR